MFFAIAAVLVVLAVILASCSSGGSTSNSEKTAETTGKATQVASGDTTAQQASTAPSGALAAVADYLEGQGHEYVGDCADARLPADKGKWCSTRVSTDPTTGTETYEVGPVGEKPQKQVTLKRRAVAQLTPGYQVGVADGNVGQPQLLTREQLEANAFITGNLVLDQAAGIGNGIGDLPAGVPTDGPGGDAGGNGGAGGGGAPPVIQPDGGSAQYPPQGEIVVENPNAVVGGQVQFRGSGCQANEALAILFDDHPIGTISSDPSGAFAGEIGIPKGTAPGAHLLTVRGSGCVFNATITVAGTLAFTGSSSNTSTYVLVGIAAVVVGLVLLVGTRRRRNGIRGPGTRSSP